MPAANYQENNGHHMNQFNKTQENTHIYGNSTIQPKMHIANAKIETGINVTI